MAVSVSSQLLESLTPGRVAVALIVLTIGSFIVDFTWQPAYPKGVPHVGHGQGVVGTIKNWIYYVVSFNDWLDEGKKYGKQNRAFVVPTSPSEPYEIVVPRSQVAWMLEQPDHVLSTHEAHSDKLHNVYQFFGLDDRFPIRTIHRHLARNLNGLIPAVQEEIKGAVDAALGTDTQGWRTAKIWEFWMAIIPRVTNLVLVGDPICRDPEFLASQVDFADAVVRNTFLLYLVPRVAHRFVAPLVVALSNRRHWRRSHRVAGPVAEQRLREMVAAYEGKGGPAAAPPPENFITWLIRQALEEKASEELRPEMITQRLLPIEFAAIHTTALTGHMMLMDLLWSDPAQGVLDALREETASVLAEEGGEDGVWSKTALSRLYKTDSAIKESMRRSYFSRGLTHRKVIAPEGITNPAEGWHAPPGSFLTVDIGAAHHDDELYENPTEYDAFRFSRAREEMEAAMAANVGTEGGKSAADDKLRMDEVIKMKRLGMVATSELHWTFSHGRHACPGRFFVAHELKMIMAYMLANYEVRPVGERQELMWLGSTVIPPMEAKFEVRRKEGTF